MRSFAVLLFFAGFLQAACASDTPTSPLTDTPSSTDAAADTQVIDVSSDTTENDMSSVDAPVTIDVESDSATNADSVDDAQEHGVSSWGAITGACGSISAAIKEDSATLLQTTYTFEDTENFDSASLEGRAKKRYDEPNAGGSSKCSEVMSMQLLVDCEDATVTKLETEIVYDTEGKIADYLIHIGGVQTGVSVTRAYKGPVVDVYTTEDATSLLEKKLAGIKEARANAAEADTWEKSMVHIWTLHPDWAQTVSQAWESLDEETKGSILVLITVEQGSDYIVTDSCDD